MSMKLVKEPKLTKRERRAGMYACLKHSQTWIRRAKEYALAGPELETLYHIDAGIQSQIDVLEMSKAKQPRIKR